MRQATTVAEYSRLSGQSAAGGAGQADLRTAAGLADEPAAGAGTQPPSSVFQLAGHTLVMLGLIVATSGDFGMALTYAFIFVIMAWAGGVKNGGSCWPLWFVS